MHVHEGRGGLTAVTSQHTLDTQHAVFILRLLTIWMSVVCTHKKQPFEPGFVQSENNKFEYQYRACHTRTKYRRRVCMVFIAVQTMSWVMHVKRLHLSEILWTRPLMHAKRLHIPPGPHHPFGSLLEPEYQSEASNTSQKPRMVDFV